MQLEWGVGTIIPGFRTSAEWGTLEAATVLMSTDRSTLTVPAPTSADGTTLRGDGWTCLRRVGSCGRVGAPAIFR
jgi:hypothetical protein